MKSLAVKIQRQQSCYIYIIKAAETHSVSSALASFGNKQPPIQCNAQFAEIPCHECGMQSQRSPQQLGPKVDTPNARH
jgi:hypothetical protein